MRNFLILLLISFAGFFISCSDNTTESNIPPHIETIEPAKASPGDIITIYGTNLGYNPVEGKILINDLVINPNQTEKWNNSFIRLQLPLTAKSGGIQIILGTDSSNTIFYEIEEKPAIEFIHVNAGTFMMGSEKGFGPEQPVHKVTISKAFQISRHEITQKIWQLVMHTNPSNVKSDNLPVMNVDWKEAISFCNELSKLYGYDTVYVLSNEEYTYDTSATGFRLPTEAEWEYACRAGSQGDFPGTGNIDDMGWYNGNSAYNPHPVGTKNPNDWGIYDMNGNAWEWCWDWYSPEYYQTSPDTDPLGPATGLRHVLRGGSCSDGASFARSANRTYPANDFSNCGFRIVINK